MIDLSRKLSEDFYFTDALSASRELLGKVLVTCNDGVLTAGIISETEAYMGTVDRASHAYGGRRTARTETMYSEGGVAYVYLIYGIYCCMNVVVNEKDVPEAVLIRGMIPAVGIEAMEKRRRKSISDRHFSDGPGRLCTALGIDHSFDAELLTDGKIYICDAELTPCGDIIESKRINIDYAGEDADKLWRFTLAPEDPLRRYTAVQR